jgi:hypothetical protein
MYFTLGHVPQVHYVILLLFNYEYSCISPYIIVFPTLNNVRITLFIRLSLSVRLNLFKLRHQH